MSAAEVIAEVVVRRSGGDPESRTFDWALELNGSVIATSARDYPSPASAARGAGALLRRMKFAESVRVIVRRDVQRAKNAYRRLPGRTVGDLLRLNHQREGSCWRWTGAHTPTGYGHLYVDGRRVGVHRLAYQEWVGRIPEGLELDHLCRTRDCINPEHLEPVTHRENLRRSRQAGLEMRSGDS